MNNLLKLAICTALWTLSCTSGSTTNGPLTCSTHNPGQPDHSVDCRLAICACESQAVGYQAKCMAICGKPQPYHCQQNPPTGPVWTVSNLSCNLCTGDAGLQTCQ